MAKRGERLVLEGTPEIEVNLRRSAKARRLSLRVSRLDGRVTLSMPLALRLETAQKFLAEKADWVRGHLSERPADRPLQVGQTVPVEGQERLICTAAGRRTRLTNKAVDVVEGRPIGPQIAGLLKTLARDRLAVACDRFSAELGLPYSRLSLRDTRSRWGSCTSAGNLMFSWRLAMAPSEVLDYVAAHEVAHLAEMNHSAAFWNVVDRLCPDYAGHRRWLHTCGTELHQIRFSG